MRYFNGSGFAEKVKRKRRYCSKKIQFSRLPAAKTIAIYHKLTYT